MKSFRCIKKSIRCNQLFVLNSVKQFRMNYLMGNNALSQRNDFAASQLIDFIMLRNGL